jgi:hippurate hydrolase
MMAGSGRWKVQFRGTGGHGGNSPHLASDITVAQANFITALQSIVSRNTPALESVVISVGHISGGSVDALNVMPSEILVGGTMRAFNPTMQKLLEDRMREVAELARVGVREAGHRLDADGCEAAERVVDLAAFVPAVVTALRECLAGVPSGVPCRAALAWGSDDSRLAIEVHAEPGNLPFPFPGDAVLLAWERRAIERNWPYHGLRRSNGMAFSLEAANLSRP